MEEGRQGGAKSRKTLQTLTHTEYGGVKKHTQKSVLGALMSLEPSSAKQVLQGGEKGLQSCRDRRPLTHLGSIKGPPSLRDPGSRPPRRAVIRRCAETWRIRCTVSAWQTRPEPPLPDPDFQTSMSWLIRLWLWLWVSSLVGLILSTYGQLYYVTSRTEGWRSGR